MCNIVYQIEYFGEMENLREIQKQCRAMMDKPSSSSAANKYDKPQ